MILFPVTILLWSQFSLLINASSIIIFNNIEGEKMVEKLPFLTRILARDIEMSPRLKNPIFLLPFIVFPAR
uniref:Putative secreted protein n=1 Tax=Anopheles darlingi TaxID=43151 RepID=A0A2M4DFZ8_ANODA